MDALEYDTFGEVLKVLRKGTKISQQELADRLGVHRNTIGAWERGENLPDSKAVVLELARLLHLDQRETQHLLTTSLTAPTLYWSMPTPRNPLFTGRDEILKTLHMHLGARQAVAPTQSFALHGLGGIGKTQLAIEYAYRYALTYSAIFWIVAESVETIMASFLTLANMLKLPERLEANQQSLLAAVQRWLTGHRDWLLIWDNLEDPELLHRFLPPARQGAILITTRRPAFGSLAHPLELSPMPPAEGAFFLLRRAKVLAATEQGGGSAQIAAALPTEYATARTLAQIMGGLPLALDQAGAYIEETGCSLAMYCQCYEQQRASLLARRGTPAGDHPHSVAATFTLAYQRLEQEQPIAAEILCVCAFLHAENIPEELFLTAASHLGPTLAPLTDNLYKFDLALAALRASALLQRQQRTHTLSLHRLVQAVLQERMSEQERMQWQVRIICALNALLPRISGDHAPQEVWAYYERVLPHVLLCVNNLPAHASSQELIEALLKGADYLRIHAQYEQAHTLYQRTLDMLEQTVGPEHPRATYALNALAVIYALQGDYEQAEPCFQRVLHLREQTLGPDHPAVAFPLNNLANIAKDQGKHAQARQLYQRCLEIRERALKPNDPQIAFPLFGLALLTLQQEGDYRQAEALLQRALHIREATLDRTHPLIANDLETLAHIYLKQAKYEQAEQILQEAVAIREQTLGAEHPHLGYALDELAHLYAEQERDEQAEACYQRALHNWETALGTEHAEMIYSLTGLADLSTRQRKYEQAEQLYRRARSIWEQAFGPDHATLAFPLTGLATLNREQGNYEQADTFYQQALTLREQHLGPQHPETAQTLHDYAVCLQRQGKYVEATAHLLRALKIRVQMLGATHPKTRATLATYDELLLTREPGELMSDAGSLKQ